MCYGIRWFKCKLKSPNKTMTMTKIGCIIVLFDVEQVEQINANKAQLNTVTSIIITE